MLRHCTRSMRLFFALALFLYMAVACQAKAVPQLPKIVLEDLDENTPLLVEPIVASNETQDVPPSLKVKQNWTHTEEGTRRWVPNPFYHLTNGYKSEVVRLSFESAFQANDSAFFDGIAPYRREWKMKHLFNVYGIELKRAAPKEFKSLRAASQLNETAYQEEVRSTLLVTRIDYI